MKIMSLIPARGGSKGIPDKNIADLAGKPLIAWTIEASLGSKNIQRTIVTTDSEKIAGVSRKYGAEVPFLRPSEISGDHSPVIPSIHHAFKWLAENEDYRPDYMVLLQPTSPLRNSRDIDEAFEILYSKKADSVISVGEASPHPYLMKEITPDGRLKNFVADPESKPRQTFPPVYFLNGAIYIVSVEMILNKNTFYSDKTYAYVMSQQKSVDVDSEIDLVIVSKIMEYSSTNNIR